MSKVQLIKLSCATANVAFFPLLHPQSPHPLPSPVTEHLQEEVKLKIIVKFTQP